jgi:hypothetical protein
MVNQMKGERIPYRLMTLAVGARAGLRAIHFHIPELSQDLGQNDFAVLTADVTYNLVDPRSGFRRISFISAISPGHSIRCLVTSLVVSESEATFTSELVFLLEIFAWLRDLPIVFLVDGDKGRIAAIRTVLPAAHVQLCLWHKGQNLQDRLTPAVLANRGGGGAAAAEAADTARLVPANETSGSFDMGLDVADEEEITLESVEESMEGDIGTDDSLDADAESDPPSIAPNSGLGGDLSGDPLPAVNFSNATAGGIFRWLQRAHSRSDALRRLAELAVAFPSQESYINGELTRSIDLWAAYARVWTLDFGLVATSIQENLHWSLKSRLKGRSVPPHLFCAFLVKTMRQRQLRINRDLYSARSMDSICQEMRSGQADVLASFQQWLKPEGIKYFLGQFKLGKDDYIVHDLDVIVSSSALPVQRRASSARRFEQLLRVDEARTARLYKIEHRTCSTFDLVRISSNGSFACTCGDFARMGGPCRHILAGVVQGQIQLSCFHHFHPVHLTMTHFERWAEHVIVGRPALPVATRGPVKVLSDASWDEAIVLTRRSWEDFAFGNQEDWEADDVPVMDVSPYRLPRASHADSSREDTWAEQRDRALREMKCALKNDDPFGRKVLATWNRLLEERINGGDVQNLGGEIVLAPAGYRVTSSNRIRGSADHRQGRGRGQGRGQGGRRGRGGSQGRGRGGRGGGA